MDRTAWVQVPLRELTLNAPAFGCGMASVALGLALGRLALGRLALGLALAAQLLQWQAVAASSSQHQWIISSARTQPLMCLQRASRSVWNCDVFPRARLCHSASRWKMMSTTSRSVRASSGGLPMRLFTFCFTKTSRRSLQDLCIFCSRRSLFME